MARKPIEVVRYEIFMGRRNEKGLLFGSKKKKTKKRKKVVKPKGQWGGRREGACKKRVLFRVATTTNGNEVGKIPNKRKYKTYEEAYTEFNKLKKESDNVRIPSKIFVKSGLFQETNQEVLLLKRLVDGVDDGERYLRDDSGKLVKHTISNVDDWVVIDRFRRQVEESYWVFGYHNRLERKGFDFIFNEIIAYNVFSPSFIKYIVVYNNKLVVGYPDGDCDLIICKNIDTAYRLYSEIEKESKKSKFKSIVFGGAIQSKNSIPTFIQKKMESMIQLKTGWTITKVRRKTTTMQNKSRTT